jgi:transcription initiation factor TFIID subunit 5
LKKEARLKEDQLRDAQALQVDSEATNLLSSYKSEGDPNAYEKAYLSYRRFVESSLDVYKVNSKAHYTQFFAIIFIYFSA